MEMTDFTRGKGPLSTTLAVITAAKKISEAGTKLDKLARQIADQCPESSTKKDLLAYLQRIALYCHQLNITSRVSKFSNLFLAIELSFFIHIFTQLYISTYHCAWNGPVRFKKMAGQKFVLFCILMGILKLKKYLKIFSLGTTFYVIKKYAWIFLSFFLVILQKNFFWL